MSIGWVRPTAPAINLPRQNLASFLVGRGVDQSMNGSNGIGGTSGSQESNSSGLIAGGVARTQGMTSRSDGSAAIKDPYEPDDVCEEVGLDVAVHDLRGVEKPPWPEWWWTLVAREGNTETWVRSAVEEQPIDGLAIQVSSPMGQARALGHYQPPQPNDTVQHLSRTLAQLHAGVLIELRALLGRQAAPPAPTESLELIVARAVRSAMVVPASDMITRDQIAGILDIDPKTVATYVERDGLPAHGLGRNQYFFRSEVEGWLKERGSRSGAHADTHAKSLARLRTPNPKGGK